MTEQPVKTVTGLNLKYWKPWTCRFKRTILFSTNRSKACVCDGVVTVVPYSMGNRLLSSALCTDILISPLQQSEEKVINADMISVFVFFPSMARRSNYNRKHLCMFNRIFCCSVHKDLCMKTKKKIKNQRHSYERTVLQLLLQLLDSHQYMSAAVLMRCF